MQNKQLKKADTVKEKNISIRLSEKDCDRLSSLCGENGITVGKLIEAFIGDLVGGTYSNGSDEHMLAQQWLDRCGFSILAEDTLLKYFLDNCYDIDDFLDDMDEIKSIEADLKEYEINPDKFDEEKIEHANNDLAAYREHYDKIYKKIIEDFKEEYPEADIEKEIQAMREWQEESMDFRYEDAKEERNKKEEMERKKVRVYKADSEGHVSERIGEFYDEKKFKDFMKYQEDKREHNFIFIKNGINIEMKEKNENKEISDSDYPAIAARIRKGR